MSPLPATHGDAIEVGLVHDVQHHASHLAVVHGEVVVLVPLLGAQQIHDAGQGLGDHPDAVVGKAVELAGLHALLLELAAVLPLVLLGGLRGDTHNACHLLCLPLHCSVWDGALGLNLTLTQIYLCCTLKKKGRPMNKLDIEMFFLLLF